MNLAKAAAVRDATLNLAFRRYEASAKGIKEIERYSEEREAANEAFDAEVEGYWSTHTASGGEF